MIEQGFVGLGVAAAVVWIVPALLGRRRALRQPAEDRRTPDLLKENLSVHRSIFDLEHHEMDDEVYVQLRLQSRAEALGIVRKLESEADADSQQATLQAEIRAARARVRKEAFPGEPSSRSFLGRAATVALLALAVLALPRAALAATPGRVVMGTSGAALPENLRITVLQNDDEGVPQGQPVFAPVAPDGTFSFEADPARSHLVGLFYEGVAYSQVVEAGRTDPVELKIYETTTDWSVVRITSDSMTVLQNTKEGQGNVLEVLQLLRYQNDSDRAFIGSESEQVTPEPSPSGEPAPQQRQVLKLPVPESAYDLAPADDANSAGLATSAQGRLVTTSAIPPGEASVAYLFKVKVPRTGWQLRREVYYPTERADLIIGKRLVLTAAPGFEFQESKTLGGESYNRYRSGELNPGSAIEADIGFPKEGADGVWIGFAAGVAVFALLLALGTVRMRGHRAAKAAAAKPAAAAPPAGGGPAREQLIEQVAELDEKFESGAIDKAEYESQRAGLLARLSAPAGS